VLTNLPGLFAASESSRVNVTLVFVVLAFFEMKTRPADVAAHNVAVSELPRATDAIVPPARLAPRWSVAEAVRLVAPAGPMRTKSPQAGLLPAVVNSGQFASSNA